MKTTFSRMVFAFVLILLVALLIVSVTFQILMQRFVKNRTIENLKSHSTTISQVAAAYYEDKTLSQRDFLIQLSVAGELSGSDVVICDAAGRLVLCSDAPFGCDHRGLTITSRDFLRKINAEEYVISEGVVEGLYPESRILVSTAIRQEHSGKLLGIVLVSTPQLSATAITRTFMDNYILLAVMVILFAIVVITLYTRRTSNPLRDMAKTATAFGHGDLRARAQVPKRSPMEIQELALAFNNMAQALEQSEYQRKEFVANVSHELKTPMTTIGGYVDGILDGTIPPQQQQRYLKIVSDETHRLSRLVRSMLDISRLQSQGGIPEEKKVRFDVCECVGKTLLTFEQKITQKQLDVQVTLPDLPVFTRACPDSITQVVYNLLDNAVKFCPEKGLLGVRVRTGSDKIYVSISNTGPTIPPEELPLLFDRFHKLDKSRSENRDGWGLGLYIAKTLICSHDQDISVSSADGVTEFTFTLKLVN